jgi:hypothetical protein
VRGGEQIAANLRSTGRARHAVTFPAEIRSRMKIKIRKRIKSKIKSKSTTHSAGWSAL